MKPESVKVLAGLCYNQKVKYSSHTSSDREDSQREYA